MIRLQVTITKEVQQVLSKNDNSQFKVCCKQMFALHQNNTILMTKPISHKSSSSSMTHDMTSEEIKSG